MDNDETTILREQLREKDKQIAELQQIISNLTDAQKDDTECIDVESDQKPDFWERHVKLSYIALCVVIVFGLMVLASPFLIPSLWNGLGSSMQLVYTFTAISFIGLGLIAWTNTPGGRKWLKEL